MSEVEPNVYEGDFPPSQCATVARYFFSADTISGQQIVEPPGAPVATFTTLSATSVNVTFADDFETDLGWTVTNGGGLTDGAWERGSPIGGGDRGDPPTDADGSGQCYLTDNVDGNSDVDGGSTTLTSPTLDASVGNAFVTYWRWFSNSEGENPFQDVLVVEVSDDGGSTWVTLETVGPGGPEVEGGWLNRFFRVADFVSPTDQFRIRFTTSDTDPSSLVEAGVDGVELLYADCTLPGDLNGDSVVDTLDLLILLAAMGPCPEPCPPSCLADLDGNCTVDVTDLLILLANWTT